MARGGIAEFAAACDAIVNDLTSAEFNTLTL